MPKEVWNEKTNWFPSFIHTQFLLNVVQIVSVLQVWPSKVSMPQLIPSVHVFTSPHQLPLFLMWLLTHQKS